MKGEDNFDWTRNSGSTGSIGTGPSTDHTTGTGIVRKPRSIEALVKS